MARYMFPNGEDRLIYQTGLSPGSGILNANGTKMFVYTDLACTALANILNEDGSANAGSFITVDGQSQIPLFQGPDGVDTVYLRPENTLGNGYRVHARYDDQIDALEVILGAGNFVSTAGGSTVTSSAAGVIGIIVKGAVGQTAALQEWQDSAGVVKASVSKDGYITTGFLQVNSAVDKLAIFGADAGVPSNVHIVSQAADRRGLVIKGAASQTANLQEWQNSAGTVISKISNNGSLFSNVAVVVGDAGAADLGAYLQVRGAAAGAKGLVLKGAAAQSANLAEFQNSSGTVLARVLPDGRISMTGTNAVVYSGIVAGALGAFVNSLTVTIDGVDRKIPYYA